MVSQSHTTCAPLVPQHVIVFSQKSTCPISLSNPLTVYFHVHCQSIFMSIVIVPMFSNQLVFSKINSSIGALKTDLPQPDPQWRSFLNRLLPPSCSSRGSCAPRAQHCHPSRSYPRIEKVIMCVYVHKCTNIYIYIIIMFRAEHQKTAATICCLIDSFLEYPHIMNGAQHFQTLKPDQMESQLWMHWGLSENV